MSRVYTRRFDHEEAARRFYAGETQVALAAEYGVRPATVGAAIRRLRPGEKDRDVAYHRAHRTTACEDCGGPAMKLIGGKAARNSDGRVLCVACRGKLRRRQPILVNGVAKLVCGHCKVAKPLAAFRPSIRRDLTAGKPGGNFYCRVCDSAVKRAYREKNKGPCARCGVPVDTVDRRDEAKPLECRRCAMKRIHASRRNGEVVPAREGTAT